MHAKILPLKISTCTQVLCKTYINIFGLYTKFAHPPLSPLRSTGSLRGGVTVEGSQVVIMPMPTRHNDSKDTDALVHSTLERVEGGWPALHRVLAAFDAEVS